eukprot:Opistho-2@90917
MSTLNPGDLRRGSVTASRRGGSSRIGGRTGMSVTGSVSRSMAGRQHLGLKKNAAIPEQQRRPAVQVLDGEGNDVTPQSLLQLKPAILKQHAALFGSDSGLASIGGTTDTSSSMTETSGTDVFSSAVAFGRSVFGGSEYNAGGSAMESHTTSGTIDDDDLDSGDAFADMGAGLTGVRTSHEADDEKETLTDADLEKSITINVCETETIWLLDIPSVTAANDAENVAAINKRNETYRNLLKIRPGNDRFVERAMQTFNAPVKNKDAMAMPPRLRDADCMVTQWDIHDSFEAQKKAPSTDANAEAASATAATNGTAGTQTAAPTAASVAPEAAQAVRDATALAASQMSLTGSEGGSVSQSRSGRHVDRSMRSMDLDSTSTTAMLNEALGGIGGLDALTGRAKGSSLQDETVLKSDALLSSLHLVERVINQNAYQTRHALYRDLPVLPQEALYVDGEGAEGDGDKEWDDSDASDDMESDIDPVEGEPTFEGHVEEDGTEAAQLAESAGQGGVLGGGVAEGHVSTGGLELPGMELLWSYRCSLTEGRNVSCIAWNKRNPDLVAVGYGQFNYAEQTTGLVCCWSLKNPEYPERVYKTEWGVMALDWSGSHASLLAVGLYDGAVAIYNVRAAGDKPILDSSETTGKHSDPVWEVKWVERERVTGEERGELLVSISTDGRVTQWSIRKGFEFSDLMKLKRVGSRSKQNGGGAGTSNGAKNEAFISRQAGGLCFDFSRKDSNIYLAGTEEGNIHRCSCSYNEQYLETFFGHTGPVYKIRWSPFNQHAFLSCSADWSVKLWHQEREEPVMSFQSSTNPVGDIAWSPRNASVFASVCENLLEIWDLSSNTLDPIISHKAIESKLSCVSFALNSEALLTGDSSGAVTVYRLVRMPDVDSQSKDEQADVLDKIMTPAAVE